MPNPSSPETAPLAIVCGAGEFPLAVASSVVASGRPVFLIGIKGSASPQIADFPHIWSGVGRLGYMLGRVRAAGAKDITLVGAVPRPSFSLGFLPDLRFLKAVLRIAGHGDNHLLSFVASELAREGLTVRGVHEIAPGLMLPAGTLGQHAPVPEAVYAAKLGFEVLAALGPYDIGQAAIVSDRRVLALEAAEGTDLMLERVAQLRSAGRLKTHVSRSVFVKTPKRGQDLRLDTPAIGVKTVQRVKAAGLAGIAVRAGQVMTPDIGTLIAAADDAGLFVLGMEPEA